MTKKDFQKYVKNEMYPVDMFHSYYEEFNLNDSFKFSLEEFSKYFNQYLALLYNRRDELVFNVIRYYSIKFDVSLPSKVFLLTKEGQVIKKLNDIK
jgi:hypothetical protein